MSDRFREFLEHIVEDGEWEYDDGPNMTEDARQFLERHDHLRSELAESQAREAGLREAAKDVQSHERDPDKGVISLGLRDNKNSREALNRLFILASTPGPSQHSDDLAVDKLAAVMKAKLAKKREEGRGGWESHETCPPGRLQRMLLDHLPKGDPVDIANFAMMLFNRGESTTGPSLDEVRAQGLEEWVEAIVRPGRGHHPMLRRGFELALIQAEEQASRLRQSEGGEG